ncbi:MAG: ABC transporter ATP-binding protein [Candidatus Cloacimonadota bacterium]|nr:MAG: ABC transporter ATP-binding protein [Candidatus Cloacimonadota bacterium]
MIKLHNIYKSFEEKHVLQGFNLEVLSGETFVILGPSGCGKSVALKIITGLLKADCGKVEIFGQDVSNFQEKDWSKIRRNFGFLFQNSALFDSLNVEDNIAFSLRQSFDYSDEEIKECIIKNLKLIGLPGIEKKMPSELSGGMKKRVGLARAIALNPKVIFYDEPTTGLDPIRASGIDNLINKLKEKLNITSLVITHDLKSAFSIADRIGLHYNGKIQNICTADEFQKSTNSMVQQFLSGSTIGPIQ